MPASDVLTSRRSSLSRCATTTSSRGCCRRRQVGEDVTQLVLQLRRASVSQVAESYNTPRSV